MSEKIHSLPEATDFLALAGWRRAIAELYATVRQSADPAAARFHFAATRDRLFKEHSQSPLSAEQRAAFEGLSYYPYRPEFRVIGRLDDRVTAEEFTVDLGADGRFRYRRVAVVQFVLLGQTTKLSLFWIMGYGGGLFLPFKDQTNGRETYGGGRYLYDAIKGADLGTSGEEIVLDFNFAYNPSCAYHPRWVCPLSPPENTLKMPVAAGEKKFLNTPDYFA